MSFENLILGLEILTTEKSAFILSILRDINRLGKTSKTRKLEKPNEAMRQVHGKLITYLRRLPVDYTYATAFRKGCSPFKNVLKHKTSRFFYLFDLKSAYRQVDISKLARIICKADTFCDNDFKEVKDFLERFCMSQFGGLPMGAPASPDLFNLYCVYLFDGKIAKLAKRYSWIYSRYSDDLTISSMSPITRSQRKEIRQVVNQAGFPINHLKSQVADLKKGPITINGVGLELGGRVFIARDYTRYIQGLINCGLQGDLSLCPKIEGAMGTFRSVTKPRTMNKTEMKVWIKYKRFRGFNKEG